MRKPVSPRTKPLIYRWFWAGAFVSIAAVSAPAFGPKSALALTDFSRNSSVNTVLKATLGEEHCAERITEWLDTLPRGRGVVLFANPEDNRAGTSADLISYLAYPRPVAIIYGTEGAPAKFAGTYGRCCAVGFLFFLPPPGTPIEKSFGGAASFVRLAGK